MASWLLYELKREAKKMKDFRTKAKEIEEEHLKMLENGYRPSSNSTLEDITNDSTRYVKDSHYSNENGSLYLFATQHELNAYEFDIIKRIVRCRKKGYFHEDLAKSIRVIELYAKEYNS